VAGFSGRWFPEVRSKRNSLDPIHSVDRLMFSEVLQHDEDLAIFLSCAQVYYVVDSIVVDSRRIIFGFEGQIIIFTPTSRDSQEARRIAGTLWPRWKNSLLSLLYLSSIVRGDLVACSQIFRLSSVGSSRNLVSLEVEPLFICRWIEESVRLLNSHLCDRDLEVKEKLLLPKSRLCLVSNRLNR
jgi:hypothetical protein